MKHFEKRPFDLVYDRQHSHFVIKLFNKAMLGTRLLARIGKREALLSDAKRMKGLDNHGPYEMWDLSYVSTVKETKNFQAQIRIYQDHTVFTVVNNFTIKGKKNKHFFGHPYISFPCFEGEDWDKGLSCLSFKRQAPSEVMMDQKLLNYSYKNQLIRIELDYSLDDGAKEHKSINVKVRL